MWWQIVVLVILTISLIGVCIALFYTLYSFAIGLQGPFYAPSTEQRIKWALELARLKPGDKFIDLGAGDGRVVVAFAQAGAQAVGLEIDRWLAWKARKKLKKAGVEKSAQILSESFYTFDLRPFDVVFLYVTQGPLDKLTPKLKKELKPGAKVISVFFKIKDWKIKKTLGDVHLYELTEV
jgi:cyclopropane fatty-acyl-phospholipid synthase-like methyltransferase